MPIGAMATLRSSYVEFLDRLIAIAPPRPRLRGVSDKASTAAAITRSAQRADHLPEIEYDKVDKVRGMNICICTSAK
jgi:large subunit ribosomal protein L5